MARKHRRSRRRLALAVVTVVVIAVVVASIPLFVRPSTDMPRRSDAVVVLGGSGPRTQKGVALAKAGYAPTLVVSDPAKGGYCPPAPAHVTVICFHPDPASTRGEARFVAKLAEKRHWTQIIVVSNTPQTTRARIRFDRCYRGRVLFDPAEPGGFGSWVRNIVYEWGALVKALVWQRGC